MNQLEYNIANSFRHVRNDVTDIRSAIVELQRQQAILTSMLKETSDREEKLYHSMKRNHAVASQPSSPKFFVASKLGKSAHEENCPFAKNIKAERKLVFDSKAAALEAGYKACDCMRSF